MTTKENDLVTVGVIYKGSGSFYGSEKRIVPLLEKSFIVRF